MIRVLSLVLLVFALAPIGCSGGEEAGEPLEIQDVVYTTFEPSKWMANRLLDGAVEVVCPVPSGADPIFWRPGADIVRSYLSARLVVVNGARYEKWVRTTSLAPSRVVDLSRGFRDKFIRFKEEVTHSHGGGEHTHYGTDGHTWVDPTLMKRQAATLAEALEKAFPEHREVVRKNLGPLVEDLDELARSLAFVDTDGSTLLASHAAYDYLARSLGWKVKNLALSPRKVPTGKDLAELEASIAGKTNPILLWESAPLPQVIEFLKARNVVSVVFSPCATLDPNLGADYLEVMRGNVKRLSAATQE